MNFKIGVSPVASGQRATSAEVEPQLIVKNGRGNFSLSASATAAMNLKVGDYVQFHNNIEGVKHLINSKDAEFVLWCEQNDYDLSKAEDVAKLEAELTKWYVAKGYQMYDRKGNPLKVTERTTKEDKKAYLAANATEIVEGSREELIERANAAGEDGESLSDEELVQFVSLEEIPSAEKNKFSGSLTANVAKRVGVGAPVNFTDSNIWVALSAVAGEKQNAIYSVDVAEAEDIVVPNGYEDVKVRIYPITFDKCVDVIKRTKADSEEESED